MNRLTLFALPKPFHGHVGTIQANAIRSWARLPDVDLMLLGEEDGTREMAAEVGAAHVVGIERNEYGTPLVSSCFAVAERATDTELMAYVNADIILMPDFRRAVERVAGRRQSFLLAGRRTDLDIDSPLVFEEGWKHALRVRARREGRLMGPGAIDYFVFRRGLWPSIPQFAIGRWVWDNWLLYEAVTRGSALFDATPSVLAVHQNHGYDHFGAEGPVRRNGPEALANLALHSDPAGWYSLENASFVVHPFGVVPAWVRAGIRLPRRILRRVARGISDLLYGRDQLADSE